ncbi:MAG TPA: NAD-binding protein [Solirubrobacteraceae bacterium]|nr:NAD-binding protein [Solirubrobacteraceae bacterium]
MLRPVVAVLAAVAVVVLGTIGYLRWPGADYGFLDALYRAVALFGLSGAVDPPVPVTLEIARILGPLVTGYAAIRGVIAVSRERAQLARVRLFARDHVVVAGLGEMGRRLAAAFRDAGYRVVAMDPDPRSPAAEGARERGVVVVPGDAADPALLARTGVERARLLFLTTGDDGVNVDAAAAAEQLLDRRPAGILTVFAHLDDPELLRSLTAEALTTAREPSIRLEFFNVHVTSARLMIQRWPPFAGTDRPHVLMVGMESVGEQLLLALANAWAAHTPGQGPPLRVTLAGPTARADRDVLLERHPGLALACDLGARELGLETGSFRDGGAMAGPEGTADVTFAYVCLWSQSQAMAAALALHARPDACDVPVVVALPDADAGVGVALTDDEGRMRGVEPFGLYTEAATPAVLLGGTTEQIARAKHEQYVAAERARGVGPEQNPSMVSWDELPESLRDSNRRFADGIGRKLAETGCALAPTPVVLDGERPDFAFTDEEVEGLARAEHDRWAADLRRDGWRPTAGPKDPEARLHPLLVPWEELPEAERDKDREPVREIPEMLARAGLRVYRTRRRPPA